MPIAIEVSETDTHYLLVIGDQIIATAQCAHVMYRMARTLTEAREAPPRDAMRLMTKDLGMCDDYAAHLYEVLTGDKPTLN